MVRKAKSAIATATPTPAEAPGERPREREAVGSAAADVLGGVAVVELVVVDIVIEDIVAETCISGAFAGENFARSLLCHAICMPFATVTPAST